jgi:Domain of unknown function (DUF4340)
MKIKLKTIVLLAIALLSASGIYFWDKNRAPAAKSELDKPTGVALFTIKETDITQVKIKTQNNELTLERQAKGWQILAPKPGPADEATVSFLLNLLATGRSERALSTESSQLQQFGLDKPATTLTFQLKDKKTHQIRLGIQSFDQSSVYASVDPPASGAKMSIALLPTSFLNATNRPLTDWQAKPKGSAANSSNPDPSQSDPSNPSHSRPSTPASSTSSDSTSSDSTPPDAAPVPPQP